MHAIAESPPIYTVTELNKQVRHFLETHLTPLWVNGEISNFVMPSSGHWYFTLKDANAAIRCALFQPKSRNITFQPENGMQILAQGYVSIYEPRGDYQFIINTIEPIGDGLRQKAFDLLKKKLAAEGLFDSQHKKPLPSFIQTVGVITSPTGAAIRDILSILKRRFPLIKVIIYPTVVQGNTAATEIAATIAQANQRQECDVLIVGRGGGPIEDLWPFNEETVVRAIFASHIPIVSAVGHEIDITLSDFVADLRAATPSAAAELISPDQHQWLQQLHRIYERLQQLIQQLLQQRQQQLQHLMHRLRHPQQQLQQLTQQLDQLEQQLHKALHFLVQKKQWQLTELSRALQAISPLATLDRGYALIKFPDSQQLINSITQLHKNDIIVAELRDGWATCHINLITPR